MLISPSADHIWYGLRFHPTLSSIRTFERLILSTATNALHLQETDNASANERLHHHHMRHVEDSGESTLLECIYCHSHQNALVETAAVTVAHERLVSDFFSFTHFVQASTHFSLLGFALEL